ncbi:MAG: redoxin domain-containing protein [Solirubrobacterales bacterium]|nr:redoxin domain-containing protein [Solirubrobacterales bacterium]
MGAGVTSSDEAGPPAGAAGSPLDHTVDSLEGKPVDLDHFRGDVVLVVNTASECGFTPQFEGLEKLYRSKRSEGFVILGFPADDVAGQEPRDDAAIAKFCTANFGVSFPMFEKTNVLSDPLNPVFRDLNAALEPPGWNFNKYLLDRDGRPVEHFDVTTEPDDPALTSAIDQALAKPA